MYERVCMRAVVRVVCVPESHWKRGQGRHYNAFLESHPPPDDPGPGVAGRIVSKPKRNGVKGKETGSVEGFRKPLRHSTPPLSGTYSRVCRCTTPWGRAQGVSGNVDPWVPDEVPCHPGETGIVGTGPDGIWMGTLGFRCWGSDVGVSTRWVPTWSPTWGFRRTGSSDTGVRQTGCRRGRGGIWGRYGEALDG